MDYRIKRIVLPIVSFVALVALACTCGSAGGTTPTAPTLPPLPTKAALPTKPPVEVPTQSSAPTKPPIGGGNGSPTQASGGSTPTGGNATALQVSTDKYSHSSGAFTTLYPVGWDKKDRDDGVLFTDPQSASWIDISFANVGTSLDSKSLTAYIDNIEYNAFSTFKNYQADKPVTQKDGSILISKRLTDSKGNPQTVASYYWKSGNIVYEQDFGASSDSFQSLSDSFLTIANSIQTDDGSASSGSLYAYRYTFTCPQKLCQFVAPYGWAWGHDEKTYKNVINDKFSSPDGTSYIDSTIYDDGTAISKSVAGQFALSLLKQFYAQDVTVSDDKVQSDGSERLDWNSASLNEDGESFFETRGTTFLMWTWVVNSDFYDTYKPLWHDIVASYTIPN